MFPVQAEEHFRAPREHDCSVDLALGHLGDLKGSDTDIFTFGYKWIEQNCLNYFPATWLLS